MAKETYDHKTIEAKWRKTWEEQQLYKTPEIKPGDEKFYSLYSFPYPSGAGLHVGHVEGMVSNDIAARYWRMRGRKVLLPMGWDSFGLPAENYAIKTGIHPQESTDAVIPVFKEQINQIGISVDWDTEVGAHWPSYYKWTQWIFLQMYDAGLAYKGEAPVNWCPKDQTVLANEQVVDGKCERCDTPVEQKMMKQWFYKITDYAERLYQDLDQVDWPESTKAMQRNWIGRSEGAVVDFAVQTEAGKALGKLKVFTTAHDTIYGATFMVVAPEHDILSEVKAEIKNWDEVQAYIEATNLKTELQRQQEKEKTGIRLDGVVVVNPLTEQQIPVFVADYVLVNYGTGAIMAVPAHDERDGEFARKYNLPIIEVVDSDVQVSYSEDIKQNLEGFRLKNSGEFDGQDFATARPAILAKLEQLGVAEQKINYRIRDWLLSRQRYWGCPIPIVYDPEGTPHPVKEEHLPMPLPRDVDFIPTGYSPLSRSEELKQWVVERYGEGWTPEYDTMDTFVDSSWYFFRHADAHNDKEFASKEQANAWLPTDLYMIGAEHIVLHLLYARFFTKFLFDKGYINFEEPFYLMRHMGMILGSDSRKMSKRWGNVLNPSEFTEEYGADALRMYEMFMGPLEQEKVWSYQGIQGIRRFLSRVYKFQQQQLKSLKASDQLSDFIHASIKKITDDTKELGYNTAIAEFMKLLNKFEAQPNEVTSADWRAYILMLAPYAPFISEELWHLMGSSSSIHLEVWPKFEAEKLVVGEVAVGVQVNGKLRDTIMLSRDAREAEAQAAAIALDNVKKHIDGKEVIKIVYVPGRIINIVAT